MRKAKGPNSDSNASSTRPPAQTSIPAVGIGASAGGVSALQAFIAEIPPETGAAYVVIVHLEPTHASDLAEILARKACILVQQVNGKMPLEPNNVYVIPPNRRLLITDHEIASLAFEEPRERRSPIDLFFRSLADQHGDRYAVVLTGAGSDGTLGARAIKEAGGLVLVQDPMQADYPSMPRSAIATGAADFVLPVRELARQLVELIKNKGRIPADIMVANDEETVKRILVYLLSRTGHDFLRYKRSTLYRRIARRMQICKVETLGEYFNLIKSKNEEVQSLFHDLLISVTTFFRDPAAFDVLAEKIIPKLYDMDESAGPLRIWVPGCASGEEAYSIAMLFSDEAARHAARRELQIFATDLDTTALGMARAGRYPLPIENDVGKERLRKYFTRCADHYEIRREIRDLVVFATHSLLKDSPFSRMDLISCRNLLIYLEKDLQQHVISTFNYALKPGGYLLLGGSESADNFPRFFNAIDREFRIYQSNTPAGGAREFRFPPIPQAEEIPVLAPRVPPAIPAPVEAHHRALETAAPPSLLVDTNFQIVHMSENAGRYFRPSGGQLRNDVTELVRPEVRFDLRTALHRAFQRNQSSLTLPIPVHFNGAAHRVFLQVRPIETSEGTVQQALVLFLEGDAVDPTEISRSQSERDQASEDIVRGLKEELELTRARLRARGEEYEAANEELRAANEELQSINEEYRSTAEELETSKEELQSLNEELQTVNVELKLKLDNVSRANDDLQNLMGAIDVGTLFLDSGLRIKLFTPKMTAIFNIKDTDVGRPVTDLTHKLDYANFAGDAKAVLNDLNIVEREVRGDGRWYLCRIRPYRTADNRIEGVVCTFVDITARLDSEQALREGEAHLRLLLAELSHRVKNTLAVVQSMARQSFSPAVPREEALEVFSDRLRALAEAHNILVSSDWRGADFRELAERQIGPYAKIGGKSVILQGPAVMLPPGIATPFALVLHELATNAIKYGALSSPAGTLRLDWGFNSVKGNDEFQFTWRESGGPQIKPPSKEGFGSWLIQNGLGDAKVELDFPAGGAQCTVTLPAESLESE